MIDPHYIRRNGYWFRPEAKGYTSRIVEAGQFSGDVAKHYLGVYGLTIHPAASVRVDLADEIARMREALGRAEAVLAALLSEEAFSRATDPTPAVFDDVIHPSLNI